MQAKYFHRGSVCKREMIQVIIIWAIYRNTFIFRFESGILRTKMVRKIGQDSFHGPNARNSPPDPTLFSQALAESWPLDDLTSQIEHNKAQDFNSNSPLEIDPDSNAACLLELSLSGARLLIPSNA